MRSALLATLIVLGCAAPTDTADTAPLVGTEWRLLSLEPGAPSLSAAPPDRIPTLHFDRLLAPPRLIVGATGPCNGFGGRYEATPDGTIRIDLLGGTRIGCEGERGALEAAYLDRLLATTTWTAWGDSLRLQAADARWLLFVSSRSR